MSNIIIPGFEELLPNSTYGKKGGKFELPSGDIPATWLMQIAKFQVCNTQQVMNLIQRAAVEYRTMSEEDRKKQYTGEAPVALFMRGFPQDELQRIIEGNEKSLAHIKEHYDDQKLAPEKYYLQVTNGMVPDDIIKGQEAEIARLGFAAYESMMSHELANHWVCKLQLAQKDRLPSRRKIENLLADEVQKSATLELRGFPGEYKDFAGFFMNLYDALARNGSPYSRLLGKNNLGKIEDNSEIFLKSRATLTIKLTAECYQRYMQMQQMQQMTEGLGEALSQAFGGKVQFGGVIEIPIKHSRKPGYRFDPENPSVN